MQLGQSREEFAKALDAHRAEFVANPADTLNGVVAEEHSEAEVAHDDRPEPEAEAEAPDDVQQAMDAGPEAGEDESSFRKRIIKMVNRSQRKAADAKKEYESRAAEIDALRQKAQAYDVLAANPDALDQVKALKGSLGGKAGSDLAERERTIREKFKDPEAYDHFMEMVEFWYDKNLSPKLGTAEQLITGLVGRHIQSDWNTLKGEFGDNIDEYRDEAFKISRERGLSLRQGAILAADNAGEDLKAAKKDMSDRAKQRKSITTPSLGNAIQGRTKPKGATSADDRIRMLAEGGARIGKQGGNVPWSRSYLKG